MRTVNVNVMLSNVIVMLLPALPRDAYEGGNLKLLLASLLLLYYYCFTAATVLITLLLTGGRC